MESLQHLRNASSPPGHATVDGKVEGVGEADEHVDEENDLANHLVVKELHHAKTCLFCFLYAIVIYLNRILKLCMFVLFEVLKRNQQGVVYTLRRLCGEGQGRIEESQR